MTRAQRVAYRFRWGILVVGLLFELAAVTWTISPYFDIELGEFYPAGLLGTPFGWPEPPSAEVYLVSALLVIGAIFLAQWGFLRPGRLLAIRLTARGRPLRSAVVIAAAMAMLLTLGAAGLLAEFTDLWPALAGGSRRLPGSARDTTLRATVGIAAGTLTVWVLWAVLFFRYWRDGDRYTQLGRMVRALIAGSVLEAVVAAPVQAATSRQTDCYCERGSYTTLVCAGAVMFWAFGPGIVLLFMRESYRRARLFPHCTACGYDLRGSPERCPECGAPGPGPIAGTPSDEKDRG